MNRRSLLTICAGFGAALVSGAASAATWTLLGTRTVDILVDRDVFLVTAARGRFDSIRLNVRGNDLYILDLKVVYSNGAIDDIPIRAVIPQGGSSRVIDLRGGDRFIREVSMLYRRPVNARGATIVELWGRR